ncbi:MAG: diguanylate cyclase, partial [Oscillospiraceae bacterium]
DLIFLDVSMPVMDGKEFLLYKKNLPELDSIPVIMITGDDSGELQSSTFALGASDYIIKPFIPAVVTRRVSNVLEANQRFKDMVREYNAMSAQVKTDLATGLMSKIGAQEKISSYFESHKGLGVLAILDMDSFKNINELFGHDYGDEMICAVADLLKLNFRKEDVVARISEDSFLIFIGELDSPKPAIDKLHGIINDVSRIKVSKENVNLTCSIGAAVSDEEFHSFDALYKNADKALYRAKCKGGNALALYDDDAQNGSVVPWINDAGSVLDAINDSIYACDRDNYNMIYANDGLCRLMGVSQEDLKGKKCYEVLMHKTCPCDFCSVPKMVEGKTYTRFFHMPNSSNIFLMHGENISRNGSRIHLEVGIDVTEVENKNLFCSEVKGFEGK